MWYQVDGARSKGRAPLLFASAFLLAFLLSACQGGGFLLSDPAGDIRDQAKTARWSEVTLDTKDLFLTTFLKPGGSGTAVLHIYIEGDGNAWRNSSSPSADPTPLDPVALNMAMSDPGPAVAYLGRPCQYVRGPYWRGCQTALWTSHRFNERIVRATASAVSYLKRKFGADRLVLIGYSGGAAIAALVAADRDDVERLITVAGTLDHKAWTEHHGVTPLFGSLNAADRSDALKTVPQVHFIGADDSIMPRAVVDSYLRRLPPDAPVSLQVIPDFGHTCCWADQWPKLLASALR